LISFHISNISFRLHSKPCS